MRRAADPGRAHTDRAELLHGFALSHLGRDRAGTQRSGGALRPPEPAPMPAAAPPGTSRLEPGRLKA